MHTFNHTLVVFVLILTACRPSPTDKLAATNQTLKDVIASIEESIHIGNTVNWMEADKTIETYCSVPQTEITNYRSKADQQEFDRLIGKYWALRIKHMTIEEARDIIGRKSHQVEAFFEALD